MIEQLAAKIKARLIIDVSGCWIWPGAKVPKGYGLVGAGEGRTTYTHRVMYEDRFGTIPAGMQIDHLCRNPPCCNPAHLEAVTPAENTRRGLSAVKARQRKGSATHCRNGHEYSGENTGINSQGYRFCRACKAESHRKWGEVRRSKAEVCRTFTAHGGKVVRLAGRKSVASSKG